MTQEDWTIEDATSDDVSAQRVCQEADDAGPGDDDYLREEDAPDAGAGDGDNEGEGDES